MVPGQIRRTARRAAHRAHLDDSHRLRRREGSDVGVQATQRLGVLQRNIIRPQREPLPRLDKRRPEPLERQPQPLGQRNVRLQMGRVLRARPERADQVAGDTHALRPSAGRPVSGRQRYLAGGLAEPARREPGFRTRRPASPCSSAAASFAVRLSLLTPGPGAGQKIV